MRIEEIRQSLRIIEQCLDNMPDGPYKSDHPLTTPPRKEHTMQDIETLINRDKDKGEAENEAPPVDARSLLP